MKNTGTLRIQTFAARQSAPMEGVTVAVQGDGFTLHCITDATGSAADIPVEAPACTLSLDEDNTIRPYAVVSLTAAKSGYRTVRIEGIQIFAGQITLAQPAMIPITEEGKDNSILFIYRRSTGSENSTASLHGGHQQRSPSSDPIVWQYYFQKSDPICWCGTGVFPGRCGKIYEEKRSDLYRKNTVRRDASKRSGVG